jgi:hypothetical protein
MKTKVDLSSYIVNVQGKDFITFPGLLAEAHAQGLITISTEFVNNDPKSPIMKATVSLEENNKIKSFTGYGDATDTNVAKKVAGALIRMAETRAVARALRFACNIDMTAIEELGVDDAETGKGTKTVQPTNSFIAPTPTKTPFVGAKAPMTPSVAPKAAMAPTLKPTVSNAPTASLEAPKVEPVATPTPAPTVAKAPSTSFRQFKVNQ